MELSAEADFSRLLKLEEEYIEKMCNEIIAVKPDLVFTEKGVSGLFTFCWWSEELTCCTCGQIWLSISL